MILFCSSKPSTLLGASKERLASRQRPGATPARAGLAQRIEKTKLPGRERQFYICLGNFEGSTMAVKQQEPGAKPVQFALCDEFQEQRRSFLQLRATIAASNQRIIWRQEPSLDEENRRSAVASHRREQLSRSPVPRTRNGTPLQQRAPPPAAAPQQSPLTPQQSQMQQQRAQFRELFSGIVNPEFLRPSKFLYLQYSKRTRGGRATDL